MPNSEDQKPRKSDVEAVLTEFDAKEDLLGALCVRTKSLIEASLQDAGIQFQSLQFRVKSRKKLKEKFLDPKKDYRKLDDITDLAGLRIITYYEDDIDRAAAIVKREFDVDEKNSIDRRQIEPDRFGYSALNFVCRHRKERTLDVEYKKFASVCCEIQVTSILSHAWSEIEHEWYDLRDAYPVSIKRRFSRLSALLELAESEFRDIRKSRTQYERSIAVQVEANVPDLAVDAVSMRSFIEQDSLLAEVDRSVAKLLGFRLSEQLPDSAVDRRSKAVKLSGMSRLQEIRNSLEKYQAAIPEYAFRCNKEIWHEFTAERQVSRGVSLHHLAGMIVALRGVAALVEFLKAGNFTVDFDIEHQVAIAKETAAKYTKS
jgi:putative GTP pyrophosphokinase